MGDGDEGQSTPFRGSGNQQAVSKQLFVTLNLGNMHLASKDARPIVVAKRYVLGWECVLCASCICVCVCVLFCSPQLVAECLATAICLDWSALYVFVYVLCTCVRVNVCESVRLCACVSL